MNTNTQIFQNESDFEFEKFFTQFMGGKAFQPVNNLMGRGWVAGEKPQNKRTRSGRVDISKISPPSSEVF